MGNLDTDPLFVRHGTRTDPEDPNMVLAPEDGDAVWIAGDCHLKSRDDRWDLQTQDWMVDDMSSPCIDAGDPLDSVGSKPNSQGDTMSMGAYGGTAGASL